jgi:hypothetical protein
MKFVDRFGNQINLSLIRVVKVNFNETDNFLKFSYELMMDKNCRSNTSLVSNSIYLNLQKL